MRDDWAHATASLLPGETVLEVRALHVRVDRVPLSIELTYLLRRRDLGSRELRVRGADVEVAQVAAALRSWVERPS